MASRARTVQDVIAARLVSELANTDITVLKAANRAYADDAVRSLSAELSTVVVLMPSFSGFQPEGFSGMKAQGTFRTDVLAYTQSDEDSINPDSAMVILDAVSDALLGGWAPVVYEDESPFPLYKTAQGFEDAEGGQVRALASFEMEVIETH